MAATAAGLTRPEAAKNAIGEFKRPAFGLDFAPEDVESMRMELEALREELITLRAR